MFECSYVFFTCSSLLITYSCISLVLILNYNHGNINKQLGKWIIPSCKIHMVEEGTLDRGPKGGGKEELGEGE